MGWFPLAIDIAIERLATTALKQWGGFTKLEFAWPTLMCFGLAFYVMSLLVRTMSLDIPYSLWAGVGSCQRY